jgi:hypothetical protein
MSHAFHDATVQSRQPLAIDIPTTTNLQRHMDGRSWIDTFSPESMVSNTVKHGILLLT